MTAKKRTGNEAFTAEERAAMKARAREQAAERSGQDTGERDVLEQIGAMPPDERAMAERLHTLILSVSPDLTPRTWYGMPAYAKNGKVICFFQSAQKFKTRYATLGFSDRAKLDEGEMWPTAYAIQTWSPAVEARIVALVRRALG